jgi:hypothetical protein
MVLKPLLLTMTPRCRTLGSSHAFRILEFPRTPLPRTRVNKGRKKAGPLFLGGGKSGKPGPVTVL